MLPFQSPRSEDPLLRFDQAREVARNALQDIIASANEAGWGTQEITVTLIEVAQSLKAAEGGDPDPADDPAISDAVKGQIGHGERFD